MSTERTEQQRMQVEQLLSTPGWKQIEEWLQYNLEAERMRIECSLPETTTQKIRGRIEMLREVLALPHEMARRAE